jgi:hypothetical protein
MQRMIELIRRSAVPANILRAAARGALSLPPAEMLEILVELASNPSFSEPALCRQAAATLASRDESLLRQALADPGTPPGVLEYFSSPVNVRVELLPALLENPSAPEIPLQVLAAGDAAEVLSVMMQSRRVHASAPLLDLLSHNPATPPHLARQAREELAAMGGTDSYDNPDVLEQNQYVIEHRAEIRSAENDPFHLIGGTAEEFAELEAARRGVSMMGAAAKAMAVAAEPEKVTPIQKIARMTVGQRVMLALKGSKDDRFILIRDGARVVSQAVLESPKVNENEVEAYAGMKNVSDNVLRAIAMKRKWMKQYNILRALTRNPRTPVDVSVPLLKGLQAIDLKNLANNRDIPDAARRIAFKLMRERMTERSK